MSYPQDYSGYPVRQALPPISKEDEEDRKAQMSMKGNLELLTEGIRKKTGQVFGTGLITLTQDAPTTHINFVKAVYHRNIPAGAVFSIPGKLVYGVGITNIGQGVLMYSLNMFESETGTVALANGGIKEYTHERPIFQSINARAVGANVTFNLAFID